MKNEVPCRNTTWWRLDRYEIADGVLRPAPRARLQRFDPWKRFYEVEGEYRTVETLWGEFAELARQFQLGAESTILSPEGRQKILDWCQHYGLLGLLLAKALHITLPPSYESSAEYLGHSAKPERALRAVVRRSYGRLAGHWYIDIQASGEPAVGNDWVPGQAAPFNDSAEHHDAIFREWIDPPMKIQTEASAQGLASYFRAGTPAHQYPRPMSEEFWHAYQEPLEQWVRAAQVFADCAQRVSDKSAKIWLGDQSGADQKELQALWTLNSLAETEEVYYDFGPGGLQEEAASGSLLSVMAKMFFWDLRAKRRMLHCATCGRVFVSNDLKAQYCKAGCRNLAQTRRHRSRQKALRQP